MVLYQMYNYRKSNYYNLNKLCNKKRTNVNLINQLMVLDGKQLKYKDYAIILRIYYKKRIVSNKRKQLITQLDLHLLNYNH